MEALNKLWFKVKSEWSINYISETNITLQHMEMEQSCYETIQ